MKGQPLFDLIEAEERRTFRCPPHVSMEPPPAFVLLAWSVCRWVLLMWGDYVDCLRVLRAVEPWRQPRIVSTTLQLRDQ